MHKNFVLRTILEYKKIGFHVRIVYTVNDLGTQGTVNILYGTTRYVWLLGRVRGRPSKRFYKNSGYWIKKINKSINPTDRPFAKLAM